MIIRLRTTNDQNTEESLEAQSEWTVSTLKQSIAERLRISAADQRLVYQGRLLKDHLTLEELDVKQGDLIIIVPIKKSLSDKTQITSEKSPSLPLMQNDASQALPNLLGTAGQSSEVPTNGSFPTPLSSLEALNAFLPPELQEFSRRIMQNPEMREQFLATLRTPGAMPGNFAYPESVGVNSLNVPQGLTREEAREVYSTQLTQMREMGFPETEENLTLLIKANGNIEVAMAMKLD
uniref:UV excision repair protein RAD23 n=1 Tax=Paramoeba aestuarina TaxID=180227 RepID=A0A6U3B5G3_9EUKA|mmetsp:Transcript_32366/g.50635  ORF Transcript_32366/g.50635 Transcript_32366/m.50635 type:complete len:236 (+) Transcript_32366:22-729(+)